MAFDRTPVTDGDAIVVGDTMLVQVIATPGHTFTHLSYALRDTATGRVTAVFTGGSLLYGSTGRPDLLGPAHKATLAAPGEVWVHCRSGYRAVIAASLLQAAGHPVVAVDDEFARAGAAGLALAAGRAA